MLTLRSFFASSLLKAHCGSQLCSSNLSLPLSSPCSSSILKQRGSCGGRIFLAAVRCQNEAATPVEVEVVEDSDGEQVFVEDVDAEDLEGDDGEFSFTGEYTGREGPDYDKDPEFAEILGSCFDDPEKAQARVKALLRCGRENQKEAEQDPPRKDWFSKSRQDHIQQIYLLKFLLLVRILQCSTSFRYFPNM